MSIRNLGAGMLAAMMLGTLIAAPLTATAQRDSDRDRRETERERRETERERRERRNNDRNWNDRRDNDRNWNDRRDNDRNNRNRNDRDWNNRNRNDWRNNSSDRRQQTKNEWRNIAIGSGAVGVLGLLKKDNTLTFAGAAGTLYSLNRYEQDRKSQSQLDRARSTYFSKPYFYRDGTRYERRTVNKNGQKYYQFARR